MLNMERTLHFTTIGALLLLLSGLVVSSCDLLSGEALERAPRGAVSEGVLAEKDGGIDALLGGAYSALAGVNESGNALGGGTAWAASPQNWIYGSVASGVARKGSALGDQAPILTIAKHEHEASESFINDLWKARYEGVTRTNAVLKLLPRVEDLSDAEASRIEAEARFLRGHFYFDLQRNFGNIPWIDETTENLKQPNTGPEHPDVWQKIEDDFEFAMNNLPEVQDDRARANRWAAAAYLAKAHLYQEEWSEAKQLFDQVINQGVTSDGDSYALVPKYQDMFNPATEGNSGEVFSIRQTAQDGSGGISNARAADVLNYPHSPSPWGCCGFFQPTLWMLNSFRVDGDGLPRSFDPADGPNVKHDHGVASTEQFALGTQTLDPRLDWTTGRRGVPFHDWGPHPGAIWKQGAGNDGPFAAKKHIYRRSGRDQFGTTNGWGAAGSAVDYKLIRFADVLLMAAEAEAELGNLGQARQYVNRVRNRAGNPQGEVTNDLNRQFALAVVDNEADMLALDASARDWVVRTDRNSTFVLLGGDSEDIDNWNEYVLPDYDVEPYPSSAFSSQEEALKRIRLERKLELAMEGHRFYDLVRWEMAAEEINAFYDFETENLIPDVAGGQFTPGRNELYPIPQRQIDLMTVDGESTLEQNPGYN